jgi:YVTN family beta-propeller protein
VPEEVGSDAPPVTTPPEPPAVPAPVVAAAGAAPTWSVRERAPRALKPWEAAAGPLAPPLPPPALPGAPPSSESPRAVNGAAPPPFSDAAPPPVNGAAPPPTAAPASAKSFPTNMQLVAVLVAAALLVGGVGVFLFRSRTATTTAPAALPTSAVAVVHAGPALLASQSLNGGKGGPSLTLPGSPDGMVTTPDGTRGYLLDTTHGRVIPVDLAHGTVGTPIPAGKLPVDEEMSADGHILYVTDNLGGALIPINTASNTPGPAVQLLQGVGAFVPSPTDSTAAVSIVNGSGQPGLLAFYRPASGLGSPFAVGNNGPDELVYSRDGATLWVTEPGVGNLPGVVLPVDVASHAVGSPIAVGHGVAGSALSPDGHLLLVSNSIDGTVSVVNLVSRSVVATVPVGAGPVRAEISADGTTAWVALALDRTLVPLDLRTDHAGTSIPLANAPTDLSLAGGSGHAWVLFSSSAGDVTFLNGTALGHATRVGNDPNLLIAHDLSSAWVANAFSDTVQRVDMSGGAAGAPIHVARAPVDVALTRDHTKLLVLSFGDGSHAGALTSIDMGTLKPSAPLPVGVAPSSLTLSPDGNSAYIANHQTNSITTVDLRVWRAAPSIALPCSPTQLVITPDGAAVYADCADSSQVLPITTGGHAVGAPITVGSSSSMVMGNQGKTIFVGADHQLQEIDVATNTVVLSHDESGNIVSLAPTPDDLTLVAVENTGGALLLIHSATLATTTSVAVGSRPGALQLNADGSRAYVLDDSQQKLYIVDLGAAKVLSTIDVAPNATSVIVPSRVP